MGEICTVPSSKKKGLSRQTVPLVSELVKNGGRSATPANSPPTRVGETDGVGGSELALQSGAPVLE